MTAQVGYDSCVETTLAVLVIGIIAAGSLVAVSALRSPSSDPLDPQGVEHWLVRIVEHRPRLARALSRADRQLVGGATIAVSFALVVGAGLVVGVIFDSIDTTSTFAHWDEAVAGWGVAHDSDLSVGILRWVTTLGGTVVVAAVAAAVGAYEWISHRSATPLLFLAIALLGIVVVNNVLKWTIMRERPDIGQLVSSSGSSFPSGHSATAAAVWAAIALVLGRHVAHRGRIALAAGAIGIACAVAASRALLGVHWLTDVVAGLVVGWTWFLLVALAFGGHFQKLGEPAERIEERVA